jgi:hypothetical protein
MRDGIDKTFHLKLGLVWLVECICKRPAIKVITLTGLAGPFGKE